MDEDDDEITAKKEALIQMLTDNSLELLLAA